MKIFNVDNIGVLFEDLNRDLDVPFEMRARAKEKHKELAEFLQMDSLKAFNSDSVLYMQGSFALGTAIRPYSQGEDYDFDVVYKRIAISLTQEELKKQVGDQLSRFIEHLRKNFANEIPQLISKSRCWTLQYNGFHIDVLPALPDEGREYALLPHEGIKLADKDLVRWQFSNPKAYALWFRQQLDEDLIKSKLMQSKDFNVKIEDIVDIKAETHLQKSIQILKRHKDIFYQIHGENKPISIIITTLAALSYVKKRTLFDSLTHILSEMESHIVFDKGEYRVENPINKNENFADKWKLNPERREIFYDWLSSARRDIANIGEATDENTIHNKLQKSFGLSSSNNLVKEAQKRAAVQTMIASGNTSKAYGSSK